MTDTIALVAVTDVLCAPHQQKTIEHGWPIPGDLMDLREQCEHCRDRMNQLARTHRTNEMRAVPFHTDNNELWIQIAAIHEAGHAVLGIRGGHRLLDVSIKPDRLADHVEVAGGGVNWDLRQIGLLDHLAMIAGGEHAMLRWLREHGLASPSNIIDARFCACHDLIDAAEWTTEAGLDLRTGHLRANYLLSGCWGQVQAVAELLATEFWVSGDQVHDLLDQPR